MKHERPYPILPNAQTIQKGKKRAEFYLNDQIYHEEF